MTSAEELYRANLALIDRVVRRVCGKARLAGADAEDFGSEMHLALIANDYAILRSWEGRCSLATFLTIAMQRLLINQRERELGKWHPSTEAQRMGAAAVKLETLTRRDGRSFEEALPIVSALDPSLTREDVAAMAERLPLRTPRARAVNVDPDFFAGRESADVRAVEAEARKVAEGAGRVVRETIAGMPLEERMLLRFRFASGMAISDIARLMQVEQRPLYRRLEGVLRRLRQALLDGGFDAAGLAELIGAPAQSLDFGLTPVENDGAGLSREAELR